MVPAARQRVRIEGRAGVYLVVWVDTERRTVDLIPVKDAAVVETVSFSVVRPVHGDILSGNEPL